MGQLLRLHFENNDHAFRILNDELGTSETSQVDQLLDGTPLTIIKNGQSWVPKDLSGIITAVWLAP